MKLKSCSKILAITFLAMLLIGAASAQSNTYYIDNTAGNDASLGTSSDQAWKTIDKVNNFNFQPGDQILFKKGGIWREQLTIPSSGIQGNIIVFGPHGTGAKPIITGADTVTNWVQYQDNIYFAEVGIITAPSQLYVDGEYYDVAHYPNSGYLIATADPPDRSSIIDSNLTLSADQIVGATVMAKSLTYRVLPSTAIGYDSATKTISLSPPLDWNLTAGYGFYLQNKFWMLDSPKEWHYDLAAGKVYLWTAENDDPNKHIVEISNRTYGVYGLGKNYISIHDLTIGNADQYNVFFKDSTNINVGNLNISGGLNGISFNNTSDSSINNNFIQNVLSDGIDVTTKVKNIDIFNNNINNAGNIGMPRTSYASILVGQGSSTNAESVNIKNNKINNSGYIGIMFFGNLITVQDNSIDRSCLVLDDCGGIYTSSYQNIGGTIPSNNTIIGNTVTNSIGNCEGIRYGTFYPCYTQAQGIYLDAVTYDTQVLNNTVINADNGIFSNDGQNNTITGNKIYKARKASLSIVSGSFPASIEAGGLVKNNIIKNNIFDSDGKNQVVYLQNTAQNETKTFGTFGNNKYCHPNTNNIVITAVKGQPGEAGYNSGNGLTYNYYDLNRWQKDYDQDLDSTETTTACPFESPDQPCGNGNCDAGETFETCPTDCTQECVDTPTLMNQYIPQWKRGEISMLALMQKMRQWKAGTGCPTPA